MALTDHALAAVFGPQFGVFRQTISGFDFYRPRQMRLGAVAQNLGEQIGERPWLGQGQSIILRGGVSAFDGEWRSTTPRYATLPLKAVTKFWP